MSDPDRADFLLTLAGGDVELALGSAALGYVEAFERLGDQPGGAAVEEVLACYDDLRALTALYRWGPPGGDSLSLP